MRLDEELTHLLDAYVPCARDRRLVRRVLGWDGQGGTFLKVAGDEAGISRERARQVFDRAIDQIRYRELSSRLDEVLAFITRMGNRDAANIEDQLQVTGLTRQRFGLRALQKTAEIFGRTPKFKLEEAGGRSFVVASAGLVKLILKTAQRRSSRFGLVTVAEICAVIAADCRGSDVRSFVHQVLSTRDDIRWLDAGQEWFWLASTPRNPLVASVRKLLSYASRVSFVDVQRAAARLPRKPKTAIKPAALREFCQQAPFCRLRGNTVELVPAFASSKLVRGPEAVVCRILRRNGNELLFERLQALCEASGVSRPNLWRIVLYSPLIYRTRRRVYRVVSPQGALEERAKAC